jgi:aldehyde dehydrogenase (NAD+)
MVRRSPVGVVSVVTPFNFPLLVPVWKIAPALAFGNTVVWKCSELVPLSAIAFVQALHAAGLPDGVINLVTGGSDVGEAMSSNPYVNAITFTGSTTVGRIVQRSMAGRDVKVQLEMGGSNPAVVLADADVEAAADHIVKGAFGAAGQRCTAIRRAIVHRSRHDELVDRLAKMAGGWRLGPGSDTTTQMPPMVSDVQRRRALDGIAACVAAGARLVVGGRVPDDDTLMHGHFLPPTVLDDITSTCFTWADEIFGPVLSIITVDDDDAAIEVANCTPYGLNAGLFTTDLATGLRLGPRLRAGMVHVNAVGGFPPHVPFGGIGDSGYGPLEQGTTAVDFFTNSQVLNLHPSA